MKNNRLIYLDKYAVRKPEDRKIWLIKRLLPGNSIVLDLGCGNGCYISILGTKSKIVVGLDISKNLCKISKESNKNAHIIHADAFHLPFRDKAFDAIWASEIVEHLPSWRILKVLKEVCRKTIIITLPNPYFPTYSADPNHNLDYDWNSLRRIFRSRRNERWKYIIRGLGFHGIPIPKLFKLVTTILMYYLPLFSPCCCIIGKVQNKQYV